MKGESGKRDVPHDEVDIDPDLACFYDGELLTGRVFEDWPSGLRRSEVEYVEGAQEGPSRDWDSAGRLRSESEYKDGSLNGLSREWDERGVLIREEVFEGGILVKRLAWAPDGSLLESFVLSQGHPNYALLEQWRQITKLPFKPE